MKVRMKWGRIATVLSIPLAVLIVLSLYQNNRAEAARAALEAARAEATRLHSELGELRRLIERSGLAGVAPTAPRSTSSCLRSAPPEKQRGSHSCRILLGGPPAARSSARLWRRHRYRW